MDPETYEEQQRIAEKVKSGEYFREARGMYDTSVHDPMAERYLYVFITALSIITLLIALYASHALYPLNTSVPFIVSSNNIVDDLPRIRSLLAYKGEKPNDAIQRFMVTNYVLFREEYDIDTFDRNISGIKLQSAEPLVKEFMQQIDPRNPESPITLYQRHSTRRVAISSSRLLGDGNEMEVYYIATVEGKGEVKKSRWKANVTFKYSGIALDEETGKVVPMKFLVTQYRTKRIQDIK